MQIGCSETGPCDLPPKGRLLYAGPFSLLFTHSKHKIFNYDEINKIWLA